MLKNLTHFLDAARTLVSRIDQVLPEAPRAIEWDEAIAFRWRGAKHNPPLEAIHRPQRLKLQDLLHIDKQKAEIDANTKQFLAGYTANNALLWGARGTGKSSLIKALLNDYADQGLRVIEVDKDQLIDLPEITPLLTGRQEHFILYCDDLSFEANDPSYKALKAALDGSLSILPNNVLIYATSNRRHLLPEFNDENHSYHRLGDEIHPGESVEEKISLSERFGLWLAFHPFNQEKYLAVVDYWLTRLGSNTTENDAQAKEEALRWALQRGSRSGRVAWQFARYYHGKDCLMTQKNADT